MGYHKPVLLKECIEGLRIEPEGVYVDATFGGGGHSLEILKKLECGRLYCFDQDSDAQQNVPKSENLFFINENFRFMKNFLRLYDAVPVDGIIADLGVSSYQIDNPEKGFSTRFDGPLDMRMCKTNKQTAKKIINNWSEEQLKEIFFLYGEIRNAAKISSEIVNARKTMSIETTSQLVNLLQKFARKGKENKFFAQIFQALRIEVNNELANLRELLKQSLDVLKPGGRLAVISYHSLEDRLVKNFMKSGNFEGKIEKDFYGNNLSPIFQVGKMITPGDDEVELNKRARSAKLRIAEKK